MNLKPTMNLIGKSLSKNSPTILTGLGVAGLLTTVILAVKATPKAVYLIDEFVADSGKDDPTKLEIIQAAWKCYIPTAAMGVATVFCMVGANHVGLRRNAALLSLYSITETTLKEYQSKVIERLGENKEQKIRDEISQDRLNNNPMDSKMVIITGKGSMLCYDSFSGRYFRSDIEIIRKIENQFNKRLLNEMWLPLNDLYYELGLETIDIGDDVGWNVDKSLLDMKFGAKLSKDDEPCIVIDYVVGPKHN